MDRASTHRIADPEVRWKNFRCFRDTGWLIIRPLTVLIGANNSGKTSVIDPLLLLNQTFTSRDATTSLVTRGSLIDEGTFGDLVFNHKSHLNVFLGLRFHTHEPRKSIEEVGTYPPGALELAFGASETPQTCVLKKYSVQDIYKRPYLERSRLQSGRYTLNGIRTGKLRATERRALEASRPVNFLFAPAKELSMFQKPIEPDTILKTNFSDQFTIYLAIISYVFNALGSIFSSLSYIGPIRERPKRYYEALGETQETVGPTGEHAPNLLRLRYDEIHEKLKYWVRRFEMGQDLRVKNLSDDIFEINFISKAPRPITNIADAGFGASQVLPLIVQAVAAEPGSLTIAEQPEIHLNPRLQCLLADLFVEMANAEHRVIVETHSEHLLLRLRRLVAIGKIRQEDVAVYFVERNEGKGESNIRKVPIQGNGHIEPADWPVGFFGETLRESLALAAAQARK